MAHSAPQKLGQNTVKEQAEHKMNAIFEFSTLLKRYIDCFYN